MFKGQLYIYLILLVRLFAQSDCSFTGVYFFPRKYRNITDPKIVIEKNDQASEQINLFSFLHLFFRREKVTLASTTTQCIRNNLILSTVLTTIFIKKSMLSRFRGYLLTKWATPTIPDFGHSGRSLTCEIKSLNCEEVTVLFCK